jgi:hypothetical protein
MLTRTWLSKPYRPAVILLLLVLLWGASVGNAAGAEAAREADAGAGFNIFDWYGYGQVWDGDTYVGEFWLYPNYLITGGVEFSCYFLWFDDTDAWFDVRALWTSYGDLSFQGATLDGYGISIQNGVIDGETGEITGTWWGRIGDWIYFGQTVNGQMYPDLSDD